MVYIYGHRLSTCNSEAECLVANENVEISKFSMCSKILAFDWNVSLQSYYLLGMNTLPINCSQCGIEFQKPISYIKQGEKRGCSNHFCSNKCCIIFNKRLLQEYKQKRIEKYNQNPNYCLKCNSILKYGKKNKYCSSKCMAIYTQKDGGHHQWTNKEKLNLSKLLKNDKRCITNPKNRIEKTCPYCKKLFEVVISQKNKICCSKKCSNIWIKKTDYYKNKGRGGFRLNSGTSKKGWYKGYFCGSSWELAWLMYQLDHNISVQRNKKGFDYLFQGKIKKYYPDFIVNDEYIEIKNYETEQVIEKAKQFPYKLKILYKKDLKDVFEYIEQKYGKNYIELYERKK